MQYERLELKVENIMQNVETHMGELDAKHMQQTKKIMEAVEKAGKTVNEIASGEDAEEEKKKNVRKSMEYGKSLTRNMV
jgi:hypothetical protein